MGLFSLSKRDQDGLEFLRTLIEENVNVITFVGICKGLGVKYSPDEDPEVLIEKAVDAFKRLRKGDRKEYLDMIKGYLRKQKELKEEKGEQSDAC